nr:PREDICTED: diacylglycerol kinase iota [Anolis carolinensis]|eukprot:XP_008108752.1 PREDICTED: diacylglycerol kinase iota [Anolis carolinensis]
MNPPPSAGEEKGAAGGGGNGGASCRGAEGGGETKEPEEQQPQPQQPLAPPPGQKEESLEEKLKSLTFRKQVSYRKAISRSGLQHLAPVQNLNNAITNGPVKESRMALEWTENAVNGEHLWLETNVSGDLCYLGEESCQVKFSKSALRRKCAACKIVVHNACMEQLEKVR